jgi:enolase-phosphatase E1
MNMRPYRAILLDIEGTTTPIDFVYQVLFPYARARMKDFIARHLADEEVRAALSELVREQAVDESPGLPHPSSSEHFDEAQLESLTSYCHRLMDDDRKLTPLKFIQGKIWEEGYRKGELLGEVFPDVLPNLRRWRERGVETCIYSSGSVLAQKLLFEHTAHGDLTGFIQHFFDTTAGHKAEPGSYTKIAGLVARRPGEIVFVSDVVVELDAAAGAGMQTLLCVRPGNHPQPDSSSHVAIRSFDEVPTAVVANDATRREDVL